MLYLGPHLNAGPGLLKEWLRHQHAALKIMYMRCTPCQQKGATIFLPVTLPNAERFSNKILSLLDSAVNLE